MCKDRLSHRLSHKTDKCSLRVDFLMLLFFPVFVLTTKDADRMLAPPIALFGANYTISPDTCPNSYLKTDD